MTREQTARTCFYPPIPGASAYIESRSHGYFTLVPRAAVQAVGNRDVVTSNAPTTMGSAGLARAT